jgi:hypothetical protein
VKYSVIPLLFMLGCSNPVDVKPNITYSEYCFATNYTILTDGEAFRVKLPNGYVSEVKLENKRKARILIQTLCNMYIQEENNKHGNWTEVK